MYMQINPEESPEVLIVNIAFANDEPLKKRVFDAMNETPEHIPLFADIARFHCRDVRTAVLNEPEGSGIERPTKKRKIEQGIPPPDRPREVILEARDISFSLPQRKKFHLSIVQYGKSFEDPNTTFALCIRNPATNEVEYEYPTSLFEYALCLPVPEKATKQYNYCFLPATHTENEAVQLLPGEGVIFTLNHGPLKSCTITSSELQAIASDPTDLLFQSLDAITSRSGITLTTPSESDFSCANPESHRKKEKAYHVKAHRGSKDGYLFFLSHGIFFGFKKPLAFFPFSQIDSVSYTAVLQRTFNLVVTFTPNPDGPPQEIEFSMLDQADFGGIDAYIKKHQLSDASMAEARRAKQFKVNGKRGAGDDGVGELQKAEQEAEQEEVDEEDELEEDYDPDEDGDSDGSGSSGEDDEYDEGDGDLVQEELGSEAEDVEEEIEEDEVKKEKIPHRGPNVDDEDQL